MEKKFNFVYLTTNLINGKQYVGDHSSNDLNSTKTINYLGSGKCFNNAKIKYGKENFKKEILEYFPTKEEAFNAQEKYIKEYNTLTPNGYNISPKGGNKVKGCHSEETLLKMRMSMLGKNKGKTPWLGKHHSEESKRKNSESHRGKATFLGKHHSEESKQKNRKNNIGKSHGPMTQIHKDKIAKTKIGKLRSEDAKQKMRKPKIKINCPYCNKKISGAMYKRWHGDNCKSRY